MKISPPSFSSLTSLPILSVEALSWLEPTLTMNNCPMRSSRSMALYRVLTQAAWSSESRVTKGLCWPKACIQNKKNRGEIRFSRINISLCHPLDTIKIWVLAEESTIWGLFKVPSNEPGMPALGGWHLSMLQILPLGGHQVVEHDGVGIDRPGLAHLFEILQGFIGDVLPLFEGDVHPVQELHPVLLFQLLDKVYRGIDRTAGGPGHPLVQPDDDKASVAQLKTGLQIGAMGGPFL